MRRGDQFGFGFFLGFLAMALVAIALVNVARWLS